MRWKGTSLAMSRNFRQRFLENERCFYFAIAIAQVEPVRVLAKNLRTDAKSLDGSALGPQLDLIAKTSSNAQTTDIIAHDEPANDDRVRGLEVPFDGCVDPSCELIVENGS